MTMILLLWIALVQGAAKPPASDATTAALRGRVTDKDSGVPIPRAMVRLGRFDVPEQRATRTDQAGRYEFTGLPAGQYSGFVALGEHRERT